VVRRIALLAALVATLSACGSEPEQVYVSEDLQDASRTAAPSPALDPRTPYQDAMFLLELRSQTYRFDGTATPDSASDESTAALGYSVCEAMVNHGVPRAEIGTVFLEVLVPEFSDEQLANTGGLAQKLKQSALEDAEHFLDTAIESYCPDQAE
jgi:hypothetical protein